LRAYRPRRVDPLALKRLLRLGVSGICAWPYRKSLARRGESCRFRRPALQN
jgi:hypothetical protein